MRLVLDTNVLIAALVARGQCRELLEVSARQHELFTSAFILDEVREKLTGKFKVPAHLAEDTVTLLRARMAMVTPDPPAKPVCRDPDDDWVLATAVAAQARCLVTGDEDLWILKSREGIVILRPAEFWAFAAGHEPKVP